MTETQDVAPFRIPRPRFLAILALALFSVHLAFDRLDGAVFLRGSPGVFLGLTLGVTLVALLLARRFRGTLEPTLFCFALFASAFVLSGMVELPRWASISSFGMSPLFFVVTLTLAAIALIVVTSNSNRTLPDIALLLFVLLGAFGGPLFIRNGAEFYAVFVPFTAAAFLTLSSSRNWPGIPLARPYLLFALFSLVPLLTTVDLDSHLTGIATILAAGFPLFCLGSGIATQKRARSVVLALEASVVAGSLCALLIVLETGFHFDFGLAFGARLPLFGQHPNIVAPFFAVSLPIILALAVTAKDRRGRVLHLICLALVIFGLVLTRSRASYLGAAIGIGGFALLAFVFPHNAGRKTPVRVMMVISLLFILATGVYFGARDRVEKVLSNDTVQFRTYFWNTASTAVVERPWLGYGYLASEPLMAHAVSSDLDGRSKDTHPHNLLLFIAMGAGIPAALLFLWVLWRFFTLIARTLRKDDVPESLRWLAIGTGSSAIALIACTAVDQGLALNTPFPLHLGLLLGLASLFIRIVSPEATTPSGTTQRIPSVVAISIFFGLTVFLLLSAEADRNMARSLAEEKNGNRTEARRLADLAGFLAPFSLEIGEKRARALMRMGEEEEALQEAHRNVLLHPLSSAPWDIISHLEWDRERHEESLFAVGRALALDPTGPTASSYALFSARNLAVLDRIQEARSKLEKAFRFDFRAVLRVPWQKDEKGRRFLQVSESSQPIFLEELLQANRRLLPDACQTNPIMARRLATTIVSTNVELELYDEALDVIREFEELTVEPWLPMTYMRQRIAGEQAAAREEGDPDSDDTSDHEDREHEGVAGQAGEAGVLMAVGHKNLAEGDIDNALIAFHRSLDLIYDIVAEREYIALSLIGISDAHAVRGDFDRSSRWLDAALYFNPSPRKRIELIGRLAMKKLNADDLAGAQHDLEDAVRISRMVGPSRDSFATLNDLGDRLATLMGAADNANGSIFDPARGTAAGLFLQARVSSRQGKSGEARQLLSELRARYPRWNPQRATR